MGDLTFWHALPWVVLVYLFGAFCALIPLMRELKAQKHRAYLDGWNACMDRYKLRPVPFPPLWKDELKLHRAPETARDGGA